jgi:hypothetical protein
MIFYHGSVKPRDKWDFKPSGDREQYGPGWCFSTSEDEARIYAQGPDGMLYRCEIDVSNMCPNEGSVRKHAAKLKKLIRSAPNFSSFIVTWAENESVAVKEALETTIEYASGLHDAIQQVWVDFYRHDGADWADNVQKIFGWSLAAQDPEDVDSDKSIVVWDSSIITILDTSKAVPS